MSDVTNSVHITDEAAMQVLQLMADSEHADTFLRLYVSGGGCSGLQYGLSLDIEPGESDYVFREKDIDIRIDSSSMKYVDGSTIDFASSAMGGGFVVDNPNNVGCGCGKSFQGESQAESCCGGGCSR